MNSTASPRSLRRRLEDAHDLGLGRHVQRRRGLVRDQEVRVAGKRTGDHHALQHASRELARVLPQTSPRVVDAHLLEQLGRAVAGGRAIDVVVHAHALGQVVLDAPERVDVGARLLEDHREPLASQLAQPPRRAGQHVLAIEQDVARRRRASRQGADDRAGRHRLAAPGLADETDDLSAVDRAVDVDERGPSALGRAKAGRDVPELDEWPGHAQRRSLRSAMRSANRLNETTSSTIASAGGMTPVHDWKMPCCASESMPPQSDVGGCVPSPRNESAARSSSE